MRCEMCGAEAPVLKTCRWRSGSDRSFTLCDACYAGVSEAVWIVPGAVTCFGTCRRCGSWVSMRELSEITGGSRRGAPSGICRQCVRASGTL